MEAGAARREHDPRCGVRLLPRLVTGFVMAGAALGGGLAQERRLREALAAGVRRRRGPAEGAGAQGMGAEALDAQRALAMVAAVLGVSEDELLGLTGDGASGA